MQKITSTLIIVLLSIGFSIAQTSQGQDTVTNYTDINGLKQGTWIKYYDQAKEIIKYKGFFKNDTPQGIFKHYFPNGNTKAIQKFSANGSCIVEMYWENGDIAARGSYDASKIRVGNWKFYYTYEELQKQVRYENGKRQGEEVCYYKNGKPLTKTTFKQDIKHGPYSFYFENGKLREQGNYINGVKEGEFTNYNPTGAVDQKGEYIKGKKEGPWLVLNEQNTFDTVMYRGGEREDIDSLENEFWKKAEWAKENQDKFKKPEDYLDNPIEYFKN